MLSALRALQDAATPVVREAQSPGVQLLKLCLRSLVLKRCLIECFIPLCRLLSSFIVMSPCVYDGEFGPRGW